jgi:hypothetical protein
MKKPALPAKVTLSVLLLGAMAAWGATSLQTASFTPPAQEGNIFAVINADRSAGARTTQISVNWGSAHRSAIRGNPYGSCAGSIAGWVLLVRHTRSSSATFTLSTTGTIVRPPYQGAPPPEVSHACYKLEKMRLQ